MKITIEPSCDGKLHLAWNSSSLSAVLNPVDVNWPRRSNYDPFYHASTKTGTLAVSSAMIIGIHLENPSE